MPKRRTDYDLPPNPTRDQIVVRDYLRANPEFTVSKWGKESGYPESGIRKLLTTPGATLNARSREKLANAIGKTVDEFFGSPLARKTFIVGIVGPGAEVQMFRDGAVHSARRTVEYPAGYQDDDLLEALEIQGDSMPPFEDGFLVFYKPNDQAPPADLIGRYCVVRLRDGRRLVKKLLKGYAAGRYNLFSWGTAIIEDQEVIEAHEVQSWTPPKRG